MQPAETLFGTPDMAALFSGQAGDRLSSIRGRRHRLGIQAIRTGDLLDRAGADL